MGRGGRKRAYNNEPLKKQEKKPAQPQLTNFDSMHPVWSFKRLDTDKDWEFRFRIEDCELIINKLKEYEDDNWHIMKTKRKSHNVKLDKLIKKVRDRLDEKKLDVDELFSLRITKKYRVWGIRELNTLEIMWSDPEHKICPSQHF